MERVYEEMTKNLEESRKVERHIKIVNQLGLHARPASMMAKLTSSFKSDIFIRKDAEEVNGKSIMGIMTLAAGKDAVLKFTAIGPDAEKAMDAIEKLIESKFDED